MPRGCQLCYEDAYARFVAGTVLAVESDPAPGVVLDRTVFYPGGGQPPGTGSLRREADGTTWRVVSARRSAGEIVHDLEPGAPSPAVGDELTVEIDWPRRHLLMRTHTALHVLCGVVWRDDGAQVMGGNIGWFGSGLIQR